MDWVCDANPQRWENFLLLYVPGLVGNYVSTPIMAKLSDKVQPRKKPVQFYRASPHCRQLQLVGDDSSCKLASGTMPRLQARIGLSRFSRLCFALDAKQFVILRGPLVLPPLTLLLQAHTLAPPPDQRSTCAQRILPAPTRDVPDYDGHNLGGSPDYPIARSHPKP